MPKSTLGNRCVFPKGGPAGFGDRRYRYKAWWCMTPDERRHASNRYPHSTPGIPDSAYAYPIATDGKAPKGRAQRVLMWTYAHTKKRVAKARAKGLAGRRRR